MAGKIKIAIVALLAVVSLETAVSAATNSTPSVGTNRFEGPGGQFKLDLPTDWKPIDPKLLQAMVDPYARDNAVESGRVIQFGFGPEMSDTVTNPPYLMIELNRIGRLPERIMALHADKDYFQRTIATSLKRAGALEFKI